MGLWRWPLLWCIHAVLVHGTTLARGQRPQDKPPWAAGWSPAPSPSWVPTPEPGASGDAEGSAVAAMAFLQTGDAQRLSRANCSRGVTAGAPGPGPPPALRATLRAAPEALAHAANFLNMLFQTNDIREASVAEDVEWYQALVRSLAEGHPWVRRAVLALDAHPLAAKPRLMLQATKGDGEILLQDVSIAAPNLSNLSWDNEWFNALRTQRTPSLRKRVLSNDLRSMETPKWQRGDSYVGDPGHVRWSSPFLECRDGKFLPTWVVTLSSAFYGLKPDLSPEFKGVVRVDVELRDVAIDQCARGPGWFSDTHRCDLNSTQESHGFVLGRYLCQCKPGFYGTSGVASGAWAGAAGADGGSRLACRPCHQGCVTCQDDAPCLIQEDRALRAAVLSCQACCMLAVFLSMLISYHFRRSKRIRASGVVLLETILFGSLLLYFPVFILYFKPSIFRCIVLRWVRMLGFAIVYGTITLKLYRVLKLFLSRTAQRVPYVSSGRVLKMLGLILVLVLWFLAAWTIGMLENVDKNIPLVIRTQTTRGLYFYICGHDRWDYMMVIAEMLFLLWGSFLCYATRTVPSAFHEPRYMGIALHNELMISAAFHVVRFTMVPSLHPDWTLLLFFAHTHGTITMTLALLFIPKFLHAGSPLREEIAAEVYEDELDMRRSGSCLNSSIASAWSEHSLDPDDIREELKKLYTQLEVQETRRMAANNPHLPRKRSSRRSLGRSIMRRVAELPEAVTRRSSGRGTPARHSSSAKWLPNAGGTSLRMKDNGSRRRLAAPRKSRSIEGTGPTLGPPEEPTPGRKMTVVAASEQSDSESLDDAPLMCKSASAQNLAGPGQRPLPRAAPLQKSLSVVAGAQDEALLAASRATLEEWHATQHPTPTSLGHPMGQGLPERTGKPQSPSAADAIPPASSSPAKGCPQEDTPPPGDSKVQKHVTYAPIKSISVDSSHHPGRVRVAVRRTPPPPPLRYQSLGQRAAPARDTLEPEEPPTDPLALAGKVEGTLAEDLGCVSPPVGKGKLLPAVSFSAQVCPWELVQEEILSQKEKNTEAAESGTPGDTAATTPSLKPSSQKPSLRSLGLAIKAFNRSRGKSISKGRREGEGSLRKRGHEREGGSQRERPSLAVTSAVSLGGVGQDSATKSTEWSRQRPSSEPTTHPWQGDTVPCQQNNNAGTSWDTAGWGDSGTEGQWDSPALGTGDSEKLSEEDVDAGNGQGPPSRMHEIPPSVGHQEGAQHPHETPVVVGSGKAQTCPQQGAEALEAQPGKDAPAAMVRVITPKEGVVGPVEGLEVGRRSIHLSQDHAKPITGSPHPSTASTWRAAAGNRGTEVCPRGAPSVPAGKGALLRQEAIASQEDSGVPLAEEKGDSQPEPLGPSWGAEWVPLRSRSAEVAPAALGKAESAACREAELCPGEIQANSSIKIEICPWEESEGEDREPGRALGVGSSDGEPLHPGEEQDMEKPPAKTPETPQVALEIVGSTKDRRAEVCPWETSEGERTFSTEICPWDVEGAQPGRERKEGERRRLAKGVRSIRPNSLGLPRAWESRSSLQAPSWSWSSTSSEGPPPKPAPRSSELPEVTSRSPASSRASVCPWEVVGTDSDAAEVCPWERGAALPSAERLDGGEVSHVKDGIPPQRVALRDKGETAPASDKGSGQRGSPSPREGAEQPSTGITAKPPALPKMSPKHIGTIDSRKAKVCPWEVEEEPLPKTEICPWEEPGSPSGKERLSQDTCGTSKGENKPGSRALEDIKAKLTETSVHQTEHRDTEIFTKLMSKNLECSKAESKKSQSVESMKEQICPWESLGMEQTPEKPRVGSPALPKSPSNQSQSGESLKLICPWEIESTDKAEICPWEGAAPPPSREKSSQDKAALPIVSRSPSMGQGVLKEKRDSTSAKQEKGSRDRESICPWESTDSERTALGSSTRSTELLRAFAKKWESVGRAKVDVSPQESLGTEQTPGKPRAGSPVLLKSPSNQSQSGESLKAEICPWEAQEPEAGDKAETCPWEGAAAPSDHPKARQGAGGGPRGDRRITRQAALASPGRSPERGSSEREAVCPWESLGMEQTPGKTCAGSPVLLKSPSNQSQSGESLKLICPWELESTDKAEICPWEGAAPPTGKEKSSQDKAALSMVSRSPSMGQGVLKEKRDSTCAKQEKGSRDRESICPWESTDSERTALGSSTRSTELLRAFAKKWESVGSKKAEVCPQDILGMEKLSEKPRAGSPALPKSPSNKSQSGESLKAEICPWEAQELKSTDKAEICPWEGAVPPPSRDKSSQDKDVVPVASRSTSMGQGVSKEIRDSTSAKQEKASRDRESICPWESTDSERTALGSSTRSTELLRAFAKKWESVGRAKVDVSPRESLGMEQTPGKPRAGSPALPRSPSNQSQSGESLKAEICPWEAQELKSTDKAETCPWEVAAAPSDHPKARQGAGGGPRGDRRITRQAALASPGRSPERGSSEREAVCPWESLDMEQTPGKTYAGSPVLLKSPSNQSQSGESLKLICPWEIEPTDKAEICPWEGAAPPPSKEKPSQDKAALSMVSRSPSMGQGSHKEKRDSTCAKQEKGSRDRESVCPWESTDSERTALGSSTRSTELLRAFAKKWESVGSKKAEVCPQDILGTEETPGKPRAGSPALPRSPSNQSQSGESLKAEICPWEAQELESTDKAEICPWEGAAAQLEKEAAPDKLSLPPKEAGASKSEEKGSSERGAICPWESLGMEEPPLKTATGKELAESHSTESRKLDICPWEAAEPTGSENKTFTPQGAARASSTGTGKSKLVAGASAVCATALLRKSKGRADGKAEHKPLCRVLPGTQPPQDPRAEPLPRGVSTDPVVGSSSSPGAGVAEVCPWEVEEDPPVPDKTSTDTRKTSEVCPWEVESVDPTPTLHRQGRARVSPGDGGRGVSETKPDVCPWDQE